MELPLALGGCTLRGGSLSLRLSVEKGVVRCRETRTQTAVPILTSTSPVSDLSVVLAFLQECRFSFVLRRGLKFAVKGRGGGVRVSKPAIVDTHKRQDAQPPAGTRRPSQILINKPLHQ